jgi:hypothetical protein
MGKVRASDTGPHRKRVVWRAGASRFGTLPSGRPKRRGRYRTSVCADSRLQRTGPLLSSRRGGSPPCSPGPSEVGSRDGSRVCVPRIVPPSGVRRSPRLGGRPHACHQSSCDRRAAPCPCPHHAPGKEPSQHGPVRLDRFVLGQRRVETGSFSPPRWMSGLTGPPCRDLRSRPRSSSVSMGRRSPGQPRGAEAPKSSGLSKVVGRF